MCFKYFSCINIYVAFEFLQQATYVPHQFVNKSHNKLYFLLGERVCHMFYYDFFRAYSLKFVTNI
jgi:hypothetical protein